LAASVSARGLTLLAAMTALMPAFAQAPPILQITIERVKAGAERDYDGIERALKEVCVRLECPNAYLALESVATPKEVWWLVAYASSSDVERVGAAYAANEQLLREMMALNTRKAGLTEPPIAHVTTYRDGSSSWRMGGERFAVVSSGPDGGAGAVFEAPAGVRFAIAFVAARADADALVRKLGGGARVFATRPEWSKPDDAWIAANPRLWGR
jgi:hypothetical protein